MKFQTKVKTVDAAPVSELLKLAQEDWSKLPTWFKKEYQQGNIFIGSNKLCVEDINFRYEASEGFMLILTLGKGLSVMEEHKFFENYENQFESDK